MGVIRRGCARFRGVRMGAPDGREECGSTGASAAPDPSAHEAPLAIVGAARAFPGWAAVGLCRNGRRRHTPHMGSRPEFAQNPAPARHGIRGHPVVLVAR